MKLLVANRGEIAVRVLRTARELGHATVAVYSEADADALHVRLADEAVRLGPAAPGESYLSAAAVLAAARATGADALHPGYGFLSENAAFAQATLDAGLRWIGPPPAAIAAMSDKAEARRRMAAAGVPVAPAAALDDAAGLAAVGFPLLVKAVAGGGGRGMRRVDHAAALPEAAAAAAAEAVAAFGDGRLYAEALVEPARHVEVQVLGDHAGRAVALGARECSVQRRNQKLLEETPVPGLPAATLASLEAAAVRAAEAVGYVGAGTVEFLLGPDGRVWFLEMNTRIQVEHGVTELVTGLDLVAEQLRLAEGGAVPSAPPPRGWAMQARVCAEDAAWLPCPGRVADARWPTGPGVRVDAGLGASGRVPAEYDSLVAKVMAWGPDRDRARARLARALDELEIVGVPTTAGVLRAVLDAPEFVAGAVSTTWLEPFAAARVRPPAEVAALAAAWAWAGEAPTAAPAAGAGTPVPTPWQTLGRWP